MADPLIGRRLGGSHRIQGVLGHGGMGVVYLGIEEVLHREEAIKVIRPQQGRIPEAFRARFLQEARLIARVNHPNIVTLYACGEESDGLLYMVMERLTGRPLSQVILDEAPLSPHAAARLMAPILAALEAAHRRGVIHRDLKPANVMLTRTGDGREVVKVLDFGLAKPIPAPALDPLTTVFLDVEGPLEAYDVPETAPDADPDATVGPPDGGHTGHGTVLGTPRYMAPEQARGEPVTPQSDLYAAGVILYELLAGRPPRPPAWQAGAPPQWPPPLPERVQAPAALVSLLRRAMSPDPARRPASAGRMQEELLELLGEPLPEPSLVTARSPAHAPRVFGGRYQVINALEDGGMGALYRVVDRLTGQTLTLKRVQPGAEQDTGHPERRFQYQLALEREFRTLAALRHPNIVSVLDYGFDDPSSAFFTMKLHEGARSITEAGRGESRAVRLDYLQQLLRAVDYLHRRGCIHRDLKPANVIVAEGVVKVLDFGLSLSAESPSPPEALPAGTLAYTAPELLRGGSPSPRSDLFAVGLIAYELLLGRYPFPLHSSQRLIVDLLEGQVPGLEPSGGSDSPHPALSHPVGGVPPTTPIHALEPPLAAVIARLLERDPARRWGRAADALAALAEATGAPLTLETAATRESYLQAARFVGRREEMARLYAALDGALAGQGGAWLVGGESGVGKSRLLAELRAAALVRGAVALQGQAHPAAPPYQLWAEFARWLSLNSPAQPAELRLLRDIAPAISAPEALTPGASLPPQDRQDRLFSLFLDHLHRLRRPLVLLLEDLHRADPESLRLLRFLAAELGRLPVLVVGTYRTEEAPELASAVPVAQRIALARLSPAEIGELVAGISGRTPPPEVVEQLAETTGGNALFLVETLRALAEPAGLDRVGQQPLPAGLATTAIRPLIRQRLAGLDAADRALLELAAVAGREVHEPLLAALEPAADLASWLGRCEARCVLEVSQGGYRFSHDQLLEGLLEGLPAARRAALHRRVAEALAVDPRLPQGAAALAAHWEAAGEPARALPLLRQAGREALERGAAGTARRLLERASALDPSDSTISLDLGLAFLLQGRSAEGKEHLARGLGQLGRPLPRGELGWALGTLGAALRALLPASTRLPAAILARVCEALAALGAASYEDGEPPLRQLYFALQTLTLPVTDQTRRYLAEVAAGLAFAADQAQLAALTRYFDGRAAALAEGLPSRRSLGRIAMTHAYRGLHTARWTDAEAAGEDARAHFAAAGLLRGEEEAGFLLGFVRYYRGELAWALEIQEEALRSARRRQDPQHVHYAEAGVAVNRLLLGLDPTPWLAEAAAPDMPAAVRPVHAVLRASLAGQRGDPDAPRLAVQAADQLLAAPDPLAFLKEGGALLVDVLLQRWDALPLPEPDRRKLLRRLIRRRLAALRGMPVLAPAAWRQLGLLHLRSGQPRRARAWLLRALEAAQMRGMPLEEARARLALAEAGLPDPGAAAEHRLEAAALLEATRAVR